jgi:hypothetical protein
MITLSNVKHLLETNNPVIMRRVYGSNSVNTYELMESLKVELSDKTIINIPKGYVWDLSSVPRIFWTFLAPDGDFQLAALIHDYCYEFHVFPQKQCDDEMLIWSGVLNGTENISYRNFDNKVRYLGVRIGGFTKY